MNVTLFHEVEQPARRGNYHVDALLQRPHLGMLADTAEDDYLAESKIAAVGLKALANLSGEFARGSQHENARGARGHRSWLCLEAMENGQGESRRLTRSRLGITHQIAAGQQMRDGLGLDRSWRGIFGSRNRPLNRFAQLQVGE